MASSKHTYTQN